MPVINQTLTPTFTPPPAAACSLTSDAANAKMKIAPYLLAPAAGAPAAATVDLLKRLGTTGSFVELVGAAGLPLAITVPTTQTGFTAYRQCPNVGLVRNLVINGGFISGSHGWTLHTNASVVVDATSVSGYAVRLIATATTQESTEDVPVEAGKAYSMAAQMRSDGTMTAKVSARWLDDGGAVIGVGPDLAIASATTAAWTEYTLANQIAPGNARSLRLVLTSTASGIAFFDAIRVMQQTGAPAAWASAHQQYISRGLAIYEAGTNSGADGDMAAVGTASYGATTATLTKDTITYFGGTKSLKVVATANGGFASQAGALATGQPITASVRCKPGGVTSGLKLISTPSNAVIGTSIPGAAGDWQAIRVSGVIAAADTGWQVQLIAGANTETSYFDNLAVENKAYDTMNADLSGQAFALASRVASSNVLPLPTAFSLSDFAVVGITRFDHAYNGHGVTFERFMLDVFVDANNRISTYISTGGNVAVSKVRAGVTSSLNDGGATAFAAGDTVSWGVRVTTTGITLFVSKNGGAVATYTLATQEALLPVTGTPVAYLGRYGGGVGYEIDGVQGALRFVAAAQSDATISALVLNAYADPTDNDLAVWGFEGQTYQIPAFDDHLVKLGSAYDWRCDTAATGANAASQQGQTTNGTVAANADAVWLKVPADPTKNYKFPVKYEEGIHKNYPRRMSLLEPLSGTAKIATMGPTAYGAEAIKLRAIVDGATGHDVLEAKLVALLNLSADLWLQDVFGGLRKVRFPNLDVHEFPLWQWNEITLVEVQ